MKTQPNWLTILTGDALPTGHLQMRERVEKRVWVCAATDGAAGAISWIGDRSFWAGRHPSAGADGQPKVLLMNWFNANKLKYKTRKVKSWFEKVVLMVEVQLLSLGRMKDLRRFPPVLLDALRILSVCAITGCFRTWVTQNLPGISLSSN